MLWSDEHLVQFQSEDDGFDHINRNAPVLIRTPKLTRFEPAKYWGGGPPGNSVVLNPMFLPERLKTDIKAEKLEKQKNC